MPFSSKSKQRAYQRDYQRRRRRKKFHEYETESYVISPEVKVSILIIILLVVAVISVLSFFDLAGPFGAQSKNVLLFSFGWGAYLFPILLAAISIFLLKGVRYKFNRWQIIGVILFFLAILGVLHHVPGFSDSIKAAQDGTGGGYVGYVVLYPFISFVGYWGAWVFLVGIGAVGSMLSLSNVLFGEKSDKEEEDDLYDDENNIEEEEGQEAGVLHRVLEKFRVWRYSRSYNGEDPEPYTEEVIEKDDQPEENFEETEEGGVAPDIGSEAGEGEPVVSKRSRKRVKIPLDLLESSSENPTAGDVDAIREKIEKTFSTFGISIEMDDVNIGPTVTQYTFKPPMGVKLSRITSLSNELALALAAHPLRMEAPIPGKSLVGIEIPNQVTATVKLKDIMLSSSFKKRSSNLAICLGKDVSGKSHVADLSKMPHILIAGSTGSGKSVAINTIIISLLYQNSPDDLKLILVDPKKVELSGYNDVPYLLTPVITDVKKTVNALKWVVSEMERRYQLLSNRGKRNIDSYNSANKKETIPHIVFIIDELADLMAVAANEVEAAIVRLAQMARAVGIHLVLATQRPSVNVLTGLIKANIPSRIAFSVPSQIDSRTILDSAGAEKLLGRGDMLFTASDSNKPIRIQGAFLSDAEIERVVNFLKEEQGEAEYHDEVTEQQGGPTLIGGASGVNGDDELYNDAKEQIMAAGKASASLLQRRLRIGYARAARLLDILEGEGISDQSSSDGLLTLSMMLGNSKRKLSR